MFKFIFLFIIAMIIAITGMFYNIEANIYSTSKKSYDEKEKMREKLVKLIKYQVVLIIIFLIFFFLLKNIKQEGI